MPVATRISERRHASLPLLALAGLALLALATGCARSSARVGHPLIVIDAGHGGQFTHIAENGMREEELNLDIAKRLQRVLERRGYRVVMTRTDSGDLGAGAIPTWNALDSGWRYSVRELRTARDTAKRRDLQARCDIANKLGADAFISIHNNSARNTAAQGTEAFYAEGDAPGAALAASIVDAASTRAGTANRREHVSDLYVCRWTNAPAALIEGAYLSNEADAKRLASKRFRDALAEGIADGIDRWFDSYPLAAAPSSGTRPTAIVVDRAVASEVVRATALGVRLGVPVIRVDRAGLRAKTRQYLENSDLRLDSADDLRAVGRIDPRVIAQILKATSRR
jgi:N-acetylmuramoyl-L-alanine amidase